MGKNKRNQIEIQSVVLGQLAVDSIEEYEFLVWCDEAVQNNVITSFKYQPQTYELFSGFTYEDVKGKKRTALRPHVYSPDFDISIHSSSPYVSQFFKFFKVDYSKVRSLPDHEWTFTIDIKGKFQRNGGDRSFSINQKWMLEKYQIYVCKVVPEDFFREFWLPEELKLTRKTKKASKKYLDASYRSFHIWKESFRCDLD